LIGFASLWKVFDDDNNNNDDDDVKNESKSIELGPFAIDPIFKGKGFGTAFLNSIKTFCKNQLKKETITIFVVNVRTGEIVFVDYCCCISIIVANRHFTFL
jgi:GNAT superfamily N-acetyltransferase